MSNLPPAPQASKKRTGSGGAGYISSIVEGHARGAWGVSPQIPSSSPSSYEEAERSSATEMRSDLRLGQIEHPQRVA